MELKLLDSWPGSTSHSTVTLNSPSEFSVTTECTVEDSFLGVEDFLMGGALASGGGAVGHAGQCPATVYGPPMLWGCGRLVGEYMLFILFLTPSELYKSRCRMVGQSDGWSGTVCPDSAYQTNAAWTIDGLI